MKRQTKTLVLLAVFVVFMAGAALLYRNFSGKVQPPPQIVEQEGTVDDARQSEGQETKRVLAPDFTVTDAEGSLVKLSDLRGKPVVLNFWASWCPPCKSEMPHFDKVWAEVGEEVAFMMVDLTDGSRETQEIGAAYVEEMGFSFPVYFDLEQDAAYTYGVTSIPTTYFIDKDGYAVTAAQSAIPEESLRKGISMITQE